MRRSPLPRASLYLACLFAALPAALSAQADTVPLDLATSGTEQPVAPGAPLTLVMMNRMIRGDYRYKVVLVWDTLRALKYKPSAASSTQSRPTCTISPSAFKDSIHNDLQNARTEKGVSETLQHYWAHIQPSSPCGPALDTAYRDEEALTAYTFKETRRLASGERLIVTVQRLSPGKQTWTFTLTTGPRGEWRTLYGFTFFPDWNDHYYAEQSSTTAGAFVIKKKKGRDAFGFAPSVLFSWIPASQVGKTFSFSPVAGVGADVTSPVLFLGLGLTYNENLMVTIGGMMQKQRRLDGRFSVDSAIKTNLGDDQLTTEVFRPNFYFGVAFHFGSSPFSGSGASKVSQGAANGSKPATGKQGGSSPPASGG